MTIVKLKIDVSGTVGDEAWRGLRQFDEIQSAAFGPKFGSSGAVTMPPISPMPKANGSVPKSSWRRRCWRNTRSRTIWSRTACWMQMCWSSLIPVA